MKQAAHLQCIAVRWAKDACDAAPVGIPTLMPRRVWAQASSPPRHVWAQVGIPTLMPCHMAVQASSPPRHVRAQASSPPRHVWAQVGIPTLMPRRVWAQASSPPRHVWVQVSLPKVVPCRWLTGCSGQTDRQRHDSAGAQSDCCCSANNQLPHAPGCNAHAKRFIK
jgi:hypothetical protein